LTNTPTVSVKAEQAQTARVGNLLRALDVPVDGIATSSEWGAAKPHRGFFDCVLKWTGMRRRGAQRLHRVPPGIGWCI
jgi:FMN phosphatase YigB (HAD superfamily)